MLYVLGGGFEAELAGCVDVGVKHLADKLDGGRLVRVLLLEVHHEPKGAILERRVGGPNDDGVPSDDLMSVSRGELRWWYGVGNLRLTKS